MELEKLIKKRDAYAGKILKLGIIIAVIFVLPVIFATLLTRCFNISYVYTLGGAFIVSWISIVFLYRRIYKDVKLLETQINKLNLEQKHKKNIL